MALNFPDSPTLDQVYTLGSRQWKWDSIAWNLVASAISGTGTVTLVSVVPANGFSGSVATDTTTPAITLTTSITGVLKGNGTALLAATAGTDFIAPPLGTAILKANSGGALANATAGTDYIAPPSGTALLKANSGGALASAVPGVDYVASATVGTATINFGAHPGSNEASVVVTGQTNILVTTIPIVTILGNDSSADHTASDHAYFPVFASLSCSSATAGTGFTIYARSTQKLTGQWTVRYSWI